MSPISPMYSKPVTVPWASRWKVPAPSVSSSAKVSSDSAVSEERTPAGEEIKKAHAASHATIFKTSTLKLGETTVRFLKPDVATARSVWILSGQMSANGQVAPTRTGILTHVLVRTDGHWLIV